jgi:hypothetical protein
MKEHFGPPWSNKVVDEWAKLSDAQLNEEEEHIPADFFKI